MKCSEQYIFGFIVDFPKVQREIIIKTIERNLFSSSQNFLNFINRFKQLFSVFFTETAMGKHLNTQNDSSSQYLKALHQ